MRCLAFSGSEWDLDSLSEIASSQPQDVLSGLMYCVTLAGADDYELCAADLEGMRHIHVSFPRDWKDGAAGLTALAPVLGAIGRDAR